MHLNAAISRARGAQRRLRRTPPLLRREHPIAPDQTRHQNSTPPPFPCQGGPGVLVSIRSSSSFSKTRCWPKCAGANSGPSGSPMQATWSQGFPCPAASPSVMMLMSFDLRDHGLNEAEGKKVVRIHLAGRSIPRRHCDMISRPGLEPRSHLGHDCSLYFLQAEILGMLRNTFQGLGTFRSFLSS